MKDSYIIYVLALVFSLSCTQKKTNNKSNLEEVMKLSIEAQKVRDFVPQNAVIAHRGTTYWAPEETEAAFRWARNIGADYLELDLQMTKDSVLIALHDNDLSRTSNVLDVFPEREKSPASEFTLKELRSLDVGSWFNIQNPERAREAYIGSKILTFKDVIMIAEGYHIKIDNEEPVKEIVKNEWTGHYVYELDSQDNGNRPGIYAETKKPKFEKILALELSKLGWNITSNPKEIKVETNKVGIANTKGRFILQSFSPESIVELEAYLPGIPKCFLLWRPEMGDNLENKYQEAINFSVENNVHFIGPSIAGEPNNYGELSAPWMVEITHKSELFIHPYTFDTDFQLEKYAPSVEGVFTNRTELALKYYKRLVEKTCDGVLDELGY